MICPSNIKSFTEAWEVISFEHRFFSFLAKFYYDQVFCSFYHGTLKKKEESEERHDDLILLEVVNFVFLKLQF